VGPLDPSQLMKQRIAFPRAVSLSTPTIHYPLFTPTIYHPPLPSTIHTHHSSIYHPPFILHHHFTIHHPPSTIHLPPTLPCASPKKAYVPSRGLQPPTILSDPPPCFIATPLPVLLGHVYCILVNMDWNAKSHRRLGRIHIRCIFLSFLDF
jgi:hypothetical protein